MAAKGFFRLFRTRPDRPVSADGTMSLGEHVRELRARFLWSLVALVLTTIGAFFIYDLLQELIVGPYNQARTDLGEKVTTSIIVSGVGGGLMIQLKLCFVAGVVMASPVWLYHVWAFIVPALKRQEKRWTILFVLVSGPLFGAGVATGYYVMPTALRVLISFTPDGMVNLNDFNEFFTFITRMLLVFGVAFQIPFFVILLNLAGVVSGKSLGRYRPFIVVGTFVFAAVATPSTDPFSMLFLAIPMTTLFLISEAVARIVDRRRQRRRLAAPQWADDEISPL